MRMHRKGVVGAILVAVALLVSACGDDDSGDDTAQTENGNGEPKGEVVVGSTNFSEQLIVANIYAGALEAEGYEVNLRPNLGTREIVQPALQNGEIDLLPEYVGTLLEFLAKGSATNNLDESLAKLRTELEKKDLTALEPAAAFDANALAVTEETAQEHQLETVSDLTAVDDQFVLGGPPECPTRPLCLPGYEQTYGLDFQEFKPLDAGGPITKQALTSGDIDVAVLFSSSLPEGTVELTDDKGLQPAENIVPVIRSEVLTDEIEQILNSVSEELDNEGLSELNERVDVDKEDPADVADDWLREHGFVE